MVNKDKLSSIFLFALLTVFSVSCGGGSSPSELESTNNSWTGQIVMSETSNQKIYSLQNKKIISGFQGKEVSTNAKANATVVKYENGSETILTIYSGLDKNKKINEFSIEKTVYLPQISNNGKYILAELIDTYGVDRYLLVVFNTSGQIVWSKRWSDASFNLSSSSYTWLDSESFIRLDDNTKTIYQINPIKDTYTKLIVLNRLPDNGHIGGMKVSPDGKKIVFSWFSKEQGGLTFWIASLDGKELRPLTKVAQREREWFAKLNGDQYFPSHSFATWSPDGKWIGGVIKNTSEITTLPINGNDNEAYGNMGDYAPPQNTSCNIPFIIPADGPVQELDRYRLKKEFVPMAYEVSDSTLTAISICNGGMQWMP